MSATKPVSRLISLARCSRAGARFSTHVLHGLVWPTLDPVIRLALAQAFIVSGVMKLAHWNTTLAAAIHEYPVPFMSPMTAVYAGASIEIGGALLLALGFMTRYAAATLFALTL
ncbi:MAG TPA: DoxX family protein, partial [Steroidobacteraceae bacterium]|nr:DoxX family protein [Steroidobacteraceae bacterium]